jgi:DNA-binding response OmpR family regulator
MENNDSAKKEGGGPKKVLLVEDDVFISRAYKDGLSRAGYDVETAFDGEEGLNKARAQHFDIILLDLIMPVLNGFETLEQLKSDPDLKRIPVVIMSNLGQESDIQKGREMGAADYMIKSNYSMKEVVAKIAGVVNK